MQLVRPYPRVTVWCCQVCLTVGGSAARALRKRGQEVHRPDRACLQSHRAGSDPNVLCWGRLLAGRSKAGWSDEHWSVALGSLGRGARPAAVRAAQAAASLSVPSRGVGHQKAPRCSRRAASCGASAGSGGRRCPSRRDEAGRAVAVGSVSAGTRRLSLRQMATRYHLRSTPPPVRHASASAAQGHAPSYPAGRVDHRRADTCQPEPRQRLRPPKQVTRARERHSCRQASSTGQRMRKPAVAPDGDAAVPDS